ncbi:MAG: tetratricopeptide repeat protein [Candidatus Sumerlaeota bacterium]|nr:tetratricopeptide repeat protein [Candidatus Sumerlaeota bacterium]
MIARTRWLAPLALIAVGVAAYCNAPLGQYCYDDLSAIRDRRTIESWSNARLLVSREYGPAFGELSYRPIVSLSYFLDGEVFHKDPFASHWINLALHLAVGLALFGLWNDLFGDGRLSFLAAAVFLVHPITTEAVNCAGFREEPLMTLFLVLAMRALFHGLTRLPTRTSALPGAALLILAAAALWLVAILSKETALAGVALVPMAFWRSPVFRGRFGKMERTKGARLVLAALAFGAALAICVVLYLRFSQKAAHPAVWPGGDGPALGFLNFCRTFVLYLRLWIAPVGLSVGHWFEPSTSYGDWRLWAGAAALGLFGAGAAWMWARGLAGVDGRDRMDEVNGMDGVDAVDGEDSSDGLRGLAGVGGLWACLALAPVAQIVPIPEPLAERFLYLPHAGMALLIAAILIGLREQFMALRFTSKRMKTGGMESRLQAESSMAGLDTVPCIPPESGTPYSRFSEQAAGNRVAAKRAWNAAVVALIVAYIGFSFARNRDWRDDTTLNIARYEQWHNARGREALGALWLSRGDWEKAKGLLEAALAENPNLPDAHRNLGLIHLREGRVDLARTEFETAVRLAPENPLNQEALRRLTAAK